MTWVMYESEAKGNDRLVLLCIADEANDEGADAFPSVDLIALKARVNRSTVLRCLARLEGGGQLLVKRPETRGRGAFNRYVVTMGRDPVELAAKYRWPAPALDAKVVEEWSQSDTLPAEDNPGDDAGDDAGNGSHWWQEAPETVAPGATIRVDALTQGAAPPRNPQGQDQGPSRRYRRGLDRPADVVAAEEVAAAERENILRSAARDKPWLHDDTETAEDRRARLERIRAARDVDVGLLGGEEIADEERAS